MNLYERDYTIPISEEEVALKEELIFGRKMTRKNNR